MYEEVDVLTHSSIRIQGKMILYFDPFDLSKAPHDADIILVTHEHYDHYSPDDINKVKNAGTILIAPESVRGKIHTFPCGIDLDHTEYMVPGDEISVNDVVIRSVPAYNVGKGFHLKTSGWLGYVVTMDGTTYYVAGDTDINEDVIKVRDLRPDVALLPCGGKFTMDVQEAASLAQTLSPRLAIPTHYGTVAGKKTDGDDFVALLKGTVNAETRIRF